jgi:uncharacterized protein YndB with AHSA1/START domain
MRMGYVENTVLVGRGRPAVFDTATTARHWPQWHPATRGVEGAVDHPMQLGEAITEYVNIAGRAGVAHWTCVEYARPERLVLAAAGEGGTTARITYTFAERDGSTEFTRAMRYSFRGLAEGSPEAAALDQVMQTQSTVAMNNLKALVEAEVPALGAG